MDSIDGIPLLQYDKKEKKFINSSQVWKNLTEDRGNAEELI
jgi:hypothetical protein